LTFFFRQMPELVENGYLYVAQPPLYRLGDGKKEIYIKDEESFNDFILKRISEKGKVTLENGEEISGKRFMDILNGLIKFYESLSRLTRKGYSRRFIELLVSDGVTDRSLFKNREFMEGFLQRLQENGFKVERKEGEENGYYEFLVTETQNGGQTFAVNWEFFSSPELRLLMRISHEFGKLNNGNFIASGDGEIKKIENPEQFLNYLMEQGKKGLTIQRYKGLGEMNPGQLWTTTMDPEKRTLLKVRIEDWVEADDIFTILMGDKVEPRRDFIQSNALEVTDLDV
jgi:DNA gyrase subunit B